MTKYTGIYMPMLVGGGVGWVVQHFLGWPGAIGLLAGGACWLAYETRRNTRRMEIDMEIMRHDIERMRDGTWP